MPSVLIIDDEPNIRRMVGALLQTEGYDVRNAATGAEGVQAIADDEPDVALLDLMMPGELDGIATLKRIRERWTELPVVMMSGRASLSDAVQATKLGAVNFLEKPLSPEAVLLALSSALELRRSRRAARTLREDLGLTGVMVGTSDAMKRVGAIIERVAPSESRVLIGGESGTGKELVAAAIHEQSPRRDKPFVRVNCAAIPRDLVESEMFGHEKGSFTGATNTRVGRFELANSGTLFLDEIGDLSIEAQAKLLRAIEAKEIQRVGGNKTIRVDVRVIAATNKDLTRAVTDGTFREDLYFRLNVIPIQLPPLRDRGGDTIELIHHFSGLQYQRSSRARLKWSDDALTVMERYSWPGNVRELANIVERLAILNTGTEIRAADVAAVLPSTASSNAFTGGIGIAASHQTMGTELTQSLTDTLDETERGLINDALARANGSIAEAARQLNTDRPNLYRRMKRLGITGLVLVLFAHVFSGVAVADVAKAPGHDHAHAAINPTLNIVADTIKKDTIRTDTAQRDTTWRDTTWNDTTQPPSLPPSANPPRILDDTLLQVEPLLSYIHSRSAHDVGFGITSGKVYNRVEGLPILIGPSYTYTGKTLILRARAYGILRSAQSFRMDSPHSGYDAHISTNFGPEFKFGLAGRIYNVVSPIERWQMTEPENGLATFLLHRDYLDYYSRHGARGTATWQINQKAMLMLGYGEERWGSIDEHDPFSVFRNRQAWRPNPLVNNGVFRLLSLDAVLDTRNDNGTPSSGWYIVGGYEYGNSSNTIAPPTTLIPVPIPMRSEYGRVAVDLRRYNRISPHAQINARLFFGSWLHGDELPAQRKFSVGGPGTLPGYDFRTVSGDKDVFMCDGGFVSIVGRPASCDKVFLGQIEFRSELPTAPFSFVNKPAFRIRSAGFTLTPQGVLFADVGRGWRTTMDWPSARKADVGMGIDLGMVGLYVAKAVTDWSEAANFFVRVRRRF